MTIMAVKLAADRGALLVDATFAVLKGNAMFLVVCMLHVEHMITAGAPCHPLWHLLHIAGSTRYFD